MVTGDDGWKTKTPFLFRIASFQVLSPVFLWVVEIDLNRTGASAKPLFLPNDCLCQPKTGCDRIHLHS